MSAKLRVIKSTADALQPPVDQGPLLTDGEVAALLNLEDPTGHKARRWVRAHVPKKKAISQRTIRWFRNDVLEWARSKDAG